MAKLKGGNAGPAALTSTPAKLPTCDVSREVRAKLDTLLGLVLHWNSRINLIGSGERAELQTRHLTDSLQLLGLLPPGDDPIGDLGSGGGFPGLVLALASGRPAHLVEADKRKAAFLKEAAARLGAHAVSVHATRMETVRLPPLAVVTARALAPLAALLPHAFRLLAPTGVAIFPKGRSAADELAAAQLDWDMTIQPFRSGTDPDAVIFRLQHIRPSAHA